MSKKEKLYNLRTGIMCESEKAIILLEQILNNADILPKIFVLSNLALECNKKIFRMNEKIGKVLNH